ncbi:cytochrome C oxidase subunit IV family protein [Pseudogulbenkiania sp. MAI-1]|uniref:cytochrome C oxidase subunit IV family protein n=1 Tax=Pseudogulbenkiania sp. MAI-1 TaxID=990370 RepID=UPI00045EB159|nr:cytochrome C oxidase subunit IV family protein [Pseudogulbenkiania sp. MAI-1]
MNALRDFSAVWWVWLWLTVLTLLAAFLAEAHLTPGHLAVAALSTAWLKGLAIVEHYMALRHAPAWLRLAVHGWLALVSALLIVSFL